MSLYKKISMESSANYNELEEQVELYINIGFEDRYYCLLLLLLHLNANNLIF